MFALGLGVTPLSPDCVARRLELRFAARFIIITEVPTVASEMRRLELMASDALSTFAMRAALFSALWF